MIAAQAEADANKIVNDSITDKILEKATIEAWDGKMPAVVGGGEYILPSDMLG
jgi:hypothetical protein